MQCLTHCTYLHFERALAVIQEDDAQSEFGLFGDPGHGGEAPEAPEPPLLVLHGLGSLSPSLSPPQEERSKSSIAAAIPRVAPSKRSPPPLYARTPLTRSAGIPAAAAASALRKLDGALTLFPPQREH